MPFRPGLNDQHIDVPMSGVTVAFIQSEQEFAASKLSNMVTVKNKSDLIATYPQDYWFRDEAQKRSPGTETAGGGFATDTTSYVTEQYGFHQDVPDEIRNNSDAPWEIMTAANMYVARKILLKREVLMGSNVFTASAWTSQWTAPSNFTKWSDWAASNPLIDADNARNTMHKLTGRNPNQFLQGRESWKYLKHHPVILERIKYTQRGVITAELIASLFELDRVVIGEALKVTTVEGASSHTYDYIYGKNGLFLHQKPRIGLMDVTAYMSLQWSNGGQPAVTRRLYNEWKMFTRMESLFWIDIKVIAPALGVFLTGLTD